MNIREDREDSEDRREKRKGEASKQTCKHKSLAQSRHINGQSAKVARLRKEIFGPESLSTPPLPCRINSSRLNFGVHTIDQHLSGLRTGGIHEFGANAALSAIIILAGRTCRDVLWCTRQGGPHVLYPPGLLSLGLDPRRLIHASVQTRDDLYWVAEEGLRSKAVGIVVVETTSVMSLTVARRLQLATEVGGICMLILNEGINEAMSSNGQAVCPVATTRWQVRHHPWLELSEAHAQNSTEHPISRFELALIRNRSGSLHQWQVEWNEAAHCLRLATQDRNRSDTPHAKSVA